MNRSFTARLFTLGLLLCLLAPASALAQRFGGVGVWGGYGRMNLHSNVGALDQDGGLTAGLFATVRLTDALSVQPALLYVQKGAQGEVPIAADVAETTDLTFDLDYVEVPVLFTLALPLTDRLITRVGAGAYGGLAVRKKTETDSRLDDLLNTDQFKDVDYGLTGTVQIEVPVQSHGVLLGVRYDYGLADLFDDDLPMQEFDRKITTGALLLMAGFRF